MKLKIKRSCHLGLSQYPLLHERTGRAASPTDIAPRTPTLPIQDEGTFTPPLWNVDPFIFPDLISFSAGAPVVGASGSRECHRFNQREVRGSVSQRFSRAALQSPDLQD